MIFPPTTLDVLFTSQCNLSCDYCSVVAEPFDLKGILDGISWFLNQHLPVEPTGSPRLSINILGGEPLLEWEGLKSLITAVNSVRLVSDLDISITVKSNLLLLDGDKLNYFRENAISIEASIDGCPQAHDTFRRDKKEHSTHQKVYDNARDLLTFQPDAPVRITVTSETIALYAESVKAMWDLGFNSIRTAFRGGPWPTEAYAEMDIQVRKICDWWLSIGESDGWISVGFIEDNLQRLKTGKPLDSCGIGASRCAITGDGNIYPCYKIVGLPEFAIGSIEYGIGLLGAQLEQATVADRETRCNDCEMKAYCGTPCLADAYVANRMGRYIDDQITISPGPEFCQVERIHYAEALRAFHIVRERKMTTVDKLAGVVLPPLPGEGVVVELSPMNPDRTFGKQDSTTTSYPCVDSTQVKTTPTESKPTPLPPAAERVKNRKKHPFGVPPGTPPPAFTDEVFTTVEPKFLVSVVYASCNEGEEVHDTVKSALDAATGPIEVIVVDDASVDHSCDNIEELSSPGKFVKLIRLNTSVGAGMARNIGFAAARGRVVVSSDAHMRYPKGLWHEVGGFAIEKHAIVCPGCAAMFGGPQGWGATLNYHRDGKIGCSYYRTKGVKPELTTGVLGACYFVPREIFDELTRWPSTMGKWGYEESTINAWAWLHGIECYCFPKYTVRHLYRSEAAKGSKEPPWGYPPTSDLNLNHLVSHMALFEKETYVNHFRPYYINSITADHRNVLDALERGMLYETGHWKKGRVHTDYEFFRDVMRVPTVKTESGAIHHVRPITVILTTYNEGREVAMTLRSLVNAGQSRFEVIIVDDASTDGSVPDNIAEKIRPKLAKHWQDDIGQRVRIIRHTTRQGVSRSRAEAIAASSGEMVAIFDAHQRMVTQYGIEWAAAWAQDLDGIVVMNVCNLGNTKSKDEKTRNARTYGARFRVKPKWGLLNAHITTKPEEFMAPRDTIIGAGYVMSKEVIERMGGWPTLSGLWAYQEQSVALRCWIMDIPMFAARDITAEHMYKSGTIPVPHVDTLKNAHLVHYLYFSDTAYAYFKPALMLHGWDDQVRVLLESDEVQEARAAWAEVKKTLGKTDEDFFRDKLGLPWPPGKWEPKK